MSALPASVNQLSATWAALVWTVLWQSTLLALLVETLCLFFRRASPNLRLWLWQIVAIKVMVAPFWTPAIPMPRLPQTLAVWTAAEEVRLPAAVQADAVPPAVVGGAFFAAPADVSVNLQPAATRSLARIPVAAERLTWASWLLLVWLAVVIALLGRIFVQRVRLGRLLRRATIPEDETIGRIVGDCAAALELRRAPAVLISADARSPFVCGLKRTALVLSPGLAESLDPQQFRQAVLHELAHLKRRDLLWSWLPELARIVYWFHPVVHWVRYRTQLERELACDQLAMVHSGRCAASYAQMLVRVVSHVSQPNSLGHSPSAFP
jgi:bla regulator protein BlaR1